MPENYTFGLFNTYICRMKEYNKLREKFLHDIKFLFPHSTNLELSITLDNIHEKDMKELKLDVKDKTLLGALRYERADTEFDTFMSEIKE
jgi:hypothetical protein